MSNVYTFGIILVNENTIIKKVRYNNKKNMLIIKFLSISMMEYFEL